MQNLHNSTKIRASVSAQLFVDVPLIKSSIIRHVSVNAKMTLYANRLSTWTSIHVSVDVLDLKGSVLDSKFSIRTLVSVNAHRNVKVYKVWTMSCASVTARGGQSGMAAKLQNMTTITTLNLKSHHTSQASRNRTRNLAIEIRHLSTEEEILQLLILNHLSQVFRSHTVITIMYTLITD